VSRHPNVVRRRRGSRRAARKRRRRAESLLFDQAKHDNVAARRQAHREVSLAGMAFREAFGR
jgi:hypothetical protein